MDKETLISNYFEKTLSTEEQIQFDFLMETDADFAKEVAFQKKVKRAITSVERTVLKKKLQAIEETKPKLKSFKVWYAAASIVLICGLGFYFTQQSTTTIYDDYYQSYPNVLAPTVRGENNNDIKSEAFFEYDNGNYAKALTLFSKLYETEKEDYSLFYKSLSFMELKRYNEALTSFEQFDLQKNNGFTPYVKWYKALTLVKLEQKEKALVLLQELANSTNPMQKIAKELVTELE